MRLGDPPPGAPLKIPPTLLLQNKRYVLTIFSGHPPVFYSRSSNLCKRYLSAARFPRILLLAARAIRAFKITGKHLPCYLHAEARVNEVALTAERIVLPALRNLLPCRAQL